MRIPMRKMHVSVALDLVDVVLQVEEAEICTADDHGEPNLPKL